MAASSSDYKSALRKMEYPMCAKEALIKIESLISSTSRSKQELMLSLISEFVFYEKEITELQQFQLVLVLCDHLSRADLPETTRNAVFISLFGGSVSPVRVEVLVKLTATAIAAQIELVLGAVGALIQQLGCSSSTSLKLAIDINNDFGMYSKESLERLKDLPKIASRFVANFMTAVATLYLNNESSELEEPPDLLLDLFTEWVSDNPTLCLASQKPLELSPSMLMMPIVTPIAGLVRWCCLSAFSQKSRAASAYNKLHLSLLKSILNAESQEPPVALNSQHLLLVVNSIQREIDLVVEKSPLESVEFNENIQLCLERFAQAIECAISAKCMYGNQSQLFVRLENLKPVNPLLQMVVKMNKQT